MAVKIQEEFVTLGSFVWKEILICVVVASRIDLFIGESYKQVCSEIDSLRLMGFPAFCATNIQCHQKALMAGARRLGLDLWQAKEVRLF